MRVDWSASETSRKWTLPTRGQTADVRESARESGDRGLGDTEAEALIEDGGPDAYRHRAPPIRAEGQSDGARALTTAPERGDTEGDEKRRRAERQDPGETGGENRRRDQELRKEESLSPHDGLGRELGREDSNLNLPDTRMCRAVREVSSRP